MRLDGQGQGRGRTGQGPSREGCSFASGEPPSRSQECAINWPNPPLVQTYVGCCSNCPRHGFSFPLLFFYPSVLFSSLSILTAPSGCGVGEKRPWVVQDEIEKGQKLWSRARMTECLHARSYRTAVVYRGQTRVWGKGERGALADGDKITLLPTHLHT